jgi:hypothetical protein
MHYFFKLELDQCRFHKRHTRMGYAELVFLLLEGSVGHIVYSGASGVRNINALFFMLRWDQYGFDKSAFGHVTLNLCFRIRWDLWVMWSILVHLRHESSRHYFSCLGGTGTDVTKNASGHVMPNLCCWILWGSAGHVVHYGESEP